MKNDKEAPAFCPLPCRTLHTVERKYYGQTGSASTMARASATLSGGLALRASIPRLLYPHRRLRPPAKKSDYNDGCKMNYCPNCGAPVEGGQNFCRNCGLDIRERVELDETQTRPEVPIVRGLGRNTVVYVTREGLLGVGIGSVALYSLALLAPLAIVTAVYYGTQISALTVYVTVWVTASALLYDELRWRGMHKLGDEPPELGGARRSWLMSWQSIRMADWNGKTLWLTSVSPRRKLSITFDRRDAPLVERRLSSWGIRYSWRPPRISPSFTRFSTLVLSLFIAGQVILVLAAVLPFFPGEEQLYSTIVSHTRNQIAGATFIGEFEAIFFNNIQVAWGGAIPFLGVLTYSIASYNTGRAIQAIAITANPHPLPSYAVLFSLYLLPHTWVEESAYPIATVAGILAFTRWRSVSPREFAQRPNWGSTKLAIALGATTTILAAAGLIETLTTYVGYSIIVLWAPLVVLLYSVIRNRRRKRTDSLETP